MGSDDKNAIVKDGIFFKIVVTEENKIYMIYSNSNMLKSKLWTKKIEANV